MLKNPHKMSVSRLTHIVSGVHVIMVCDADLREFCGIREEFLEIILLFKLVAMPIMNMIRVHLRT